MHPTPLVSTIPIPADPSALFCGPRRRLPLPIPGEAPGASPQSDKCFTGIPTRNRVKDLDRVAEAVEAALAAKDSAREDALKTSRDIVRLSGAVIRAVHRGEDPAHALSEATQAAEALRDRMADHPDIYHTGAVTNGLMELAEAHLVVAAHQGAALPGHDTLPVTPQAYVLGLGDLVGELRRMALDDLAQGRVEAAKGRLDEMEDVFTALLRFDFPSALVETRRKQDIARGLLERTRGEIAVATRGRKLEDKMTELKSMLDELESKDRKNAPASKGEPRRTGIDLDVDSVY